MNPVKGSQKREIKRWSEQQIQQGSHLITDGLTAFNGVDAAGL
ncbi:protein of unknown function [Methylotuvimicrobium alcaliphilum 20Z]|uniref:ISXO2-like transposase domain-containing protein n=1 Tax=Methylotuvimicrobium alcaliphilum (strain DSM 19304 / NCIMB 14124 / VKM B-2133 / 20Z) TaxID=1091494 RepID=G4SYS9_META2|nr:protein of unknown function [Methylotuvimicrobium alcaliphilum 20Z]